jgi:hypothetical protein
MICWPLIPSVSQRAGDRVQAEDHTDAELITLAVIAALRGFTSEDSFLRYARRNLLGMFSKLPQQPGYNKRLRKLHHTIPG